LEKKDSAQIFRANEDDDDDSEAKQKNPVWTLLIKFAGLAQAQTNGKARAYNVTLGERSGMELD